MSAQQPDVVDDASATAAELLQRAAADYAGNKPAEPKDAPAAR
nr:hypothetical protein [Streptomyces sp. SID7834]